MNEFIAGSLSGFSQTIIGHPFDTVKVCIQNGQSFSPKNMSFSDYFRGMSYPLGFSIMINALSFSAYNSLLTKYNQNHIVAGTLSGLLVSPIIHFQDIGKIQRQLGNSLTLQSFLTLRGIHSTMLRECCALSIYFSTYNIMRSHDYNSLISGGIAGLTNWTLTYPLDVIRNRVYGQNISMFDALRLGSLWRGYSFCASRAIIVNAVGFKVYEDCKTLLEQTA